MCILFENDPHLADGWGCCRCRTYNGLHRQECKHCGAAPCALSGAAGDVLNAPEPPVVPVVPVPCECGGPNVCSCNPDSCTCARCWA